MLWGFPDNFKWKGAGAERETTAPNWVGLSTVWGEGHSPVVEGIFDNLRHDGISTFPVVAHAEVIRGSAGRGENVRQPKMVRCAARNWNLYAQLACSKHALDWTISYVDGYSFLF